MGDWLSANQVAPPTPASGYNILYPSSVDKLWHAFNDTGNNGALLPSMGMFSAADFTGTNVNTAQPIFDTSLDVITVVGSTTYLMEGAFHIHTTGTTSHTLGLLFGGTATLTSIGYWADATNVATEILGAVSRIHSAVATVIVVSSALASATHHSIHLKGIVRINAAGTFIPQYQWSAAPGVAGVTLANGYFMMKPIGINTMTILGPVA
jgi:hypothetical protein